MADQDQIRKALSEAERANLRLDGHEDLCKERWTRTHEALRSLRTQLWGLVGIILLANVTTLVAVWQITRGSTQ